MRGLFIFNKVNDIVFYKIDDELKENLILKGSQCGLISDVNYKQVANSTFRNFLVQAFSPMVTSQHIMENQFDNSYKSIVNVDNTFLVFGERLGYMFIYIDHLLSNTLLRGERQLNVFIEYTRLLCGPSLQILGNLLGEQDSQNISPSQTLSFLFDVWDELYENEMSFLVEGVERLLINRELSCICLNLIENVFTKLKSTLNPLQEIFRHAFILVDSKLLYLYSSQNAMDISKGDILLLIALVKVLHSDKNFYHYTDTQKCFEVKTDDSLKVQLKRRASFLERLFETMTVGENNVTPGIEVMEEEQNFILEGLFENQRHLGIFLRNRSNNYLNPTPHILHSVAINDKMKLVVLAEVPQWNVMASGFSACAETLHNLVKHPLEGNRTLTTKKLLDQHFLRIQNSLKKLKLIADHDRIIKLILHKWENLKQGGLNKFLQNNSRLILAPRLEIAITGLCELLQESFEILIYNSLNKSEPYYTRAPIVAQNLRMIEEGFRRRLADSMDYLFVKAADNISMASYFQEYPGLIHFIYVDRNMGYTLSPSLKEEYNQERPEYTASVSKFKVWEMVEICYSQLNRGKHSILFQDSHFYYSFCLWFEDLNGKPLKPRQFPCVRRYPLPGIISGEFYQNLVFESFPDRKSTYSDKVQVYELFTIHVGIITPPVIFEQSKKLAASLWEISGAAQTPLDLL